MTFRELRPEVTAFEQSVRMAGARKRASQMAAKHAYDVAIACIAPGKSYAAFHSEKKELGVVRDKAVQEASEAHTDDMASAAGRYLAEVDAQRAFKD